MKNFLTTIFLVTVSSTLFAHEGHGHETALSPKHYLLNVEHLIPVVFVVLAALAGWFLIRRFKTSRDK